MDTLEGWAGIFEKSTLTWHSTGFLSSMSSMEFENIIEGFSKLRSKEVVSYSLDASRCIGFVGHILQRVRYIYAKV